MRDALTIPIQPWRPIPAAPSRALAEAVEVAQDTGATVATTVALAERAMLAIDRQDWPEGRDPG